MLFILLFLLALITIGGGVLVVICALMIDYFEHEGEEPTFLDWNDDENDNDKND